MTDRFDVGATVPVVTVDMRADVRAHIIRLATAATPTIHSFDGLGSTDKTFSDGGRAQGLGDMLLRAKYRFFDVAGGGLAGGLDLRLPTGDAAQLLGGGHLQTKVGLIGSLAQGPFSPHVNVGYTFSSGGKVDPLSVLPQLPDEFSYAAGFDYAPAARLTVSADFLGRSLRDVGRLVPVNRQFAFVDQAGAFGTSAFEEFARQPGDLTLTVSALGVRFNPRGNFLVSAQVLIPMTSAGLRDRVTPVVGIDYSF